MIQTAYTDYDTFILFLLNLGTVYCFRVCLPYLENWNQLRTRSCAYCCLALIMLEKLQFWSSLHPKILLKLHLRKY